MEGSGKPSNGLKQGSNPIQQEFKKSTPGKRDRENTALQLVDETREARVEVQRRLRRNPQQSHQTR